MVARRRSSLIMRAANSSASRASTCRRAAFRNRFRTGERGWYREGGRERVVEGEGGKEGKGEKN